jgi:outer membrane protein assembly factor BamB
MDVEHGEGPGRLCCIDPRGTGDISAELAVDAEGNFIPHRRFQAVDPDQGERAIPNPNSGLVWEYTEQDRNGDGRVKFDERFHRTMSNVAIKDDLLVTVDGSGLVHCLDANTGKVYWTGDMLASVTCSPLIVADTVYVADEDGDVAVFPLSADPQVALKSVRNRFVPLHEVSVGESVNCSPVFANGTLYVSSRRWLFAIAATENRPNETGGGNSPKTLGSSRSIFHCRAFRRIAR